MFYRKAARPPKPAPTKTSTGAAIEHAAAAWLEARGLRCLERNFRCRGGEIDLIMRADHILVFVEVRLRNRDDFGSAAESVTAAKQRRVVHAAQYYLAMRAGSMDMACRFDVLAARQTNGGIEWQWVQDAFYAG